MLAPQLNLVPTETTFDPPIRNTPCMRMRALFCRSQNIMSSSSASSSPYPFATAPDIIRSHQKDAYFTGHLTQILSDLHRRLRGARLTHARAPEIQTLATLAYFALTTIPGNRTLGEEYCDLVQIDARDGQLPAIGRRAGYVAASILLPYIAARILPGLRARLRKLLQRRLESLRKRDDGSATGREARIKSYRVLSLVEIGSAVLQLKRIEALRYVFTRTVPDTPDRAGYELLGVLLVIQLAVQGYTHIRSTITESAARERAAFGASDDISLNHDGAYNGDNNLLLSTGASSSKAKVDIFAATHTPAAAVPRVQLTDDKAMGYIKGGQQRKRLGERKARMPIMSS
uniref:RING-type E3 ubiquitin transferase n=1 Tax=Fusarium oxysporum (strain Fo5176) TaxID=660025 RepID=A0A0D2XCV5_FUSOF